MLRSRQYSAGRAVYSQMNRLDEAVVGDLLDRISQALVKTPSLPRGMQVDGRPTSTRDGHLRFYLRGGGGSLRIIPIAALHDLQVALGVGFRVDVVTGQQPNSPVLHVDYHQDTAPSRWLWWQQLPARPVLVMAASMVGMLWSSYVLWSRWVEYESVFGRLWT